MFLNHTFELSMILDSGPFQKIFTTKASYLKELGDEYLDTSLSVKGLTIIYRDSCYKKKVRVLVNAGIVVDNPSTPTSCSASWTSISLNIFERDRVLQGSYISFKDMTMLLAEIEKDFKQQNKYPFKIGSLDTASDLVKRNSRLPGFTQSPPGQSYDEKLAEAIMWTLPQRQVANSRLQAKLQIGNNRANRLLSRMEEWGLIHKLHGNLGWETIPECFEDIPITVINYLNESGVTEAEIRSIFQGDSDA